MSIHARQYRGGRERCLNIGTRETRVIEVSAGVSLSAPEGKGSSPSARYRVRDRGSLPRERLFEQDLLTRLKLPWLFPISPRVTLQPYVPLPPRVAARRFSLLALSSHPCHERLTFTEGCSFFTHSRRSYLGNYYRSGHFKAFPGRTPLGSIVLRGTLSMVL